MERETLEGNDRRVVAQFADGSEKTIEFRSSAAEVGCPHMSIFRTQPRPNEKW